MVGRVRRGKLGMDGRSDELCCSIRVRICVRSKGCEPNKPSLPPTIPKTNDIVTLSDLKLHSSVVCLI